MTNNGAGVFLYGPNALLEHMAFYGCENVGTSSHGGALFFSNSAVVNNCTFAGNIAFRGGAIYVGTGPVEVYNSTFFNNTGWWQGGAAYYSDVTVTNGSVFESNVAYDDAGAVYVTDPGTFGDCAFRNNSATFNDGAIYTTTVDVQIERSVFESNTAGADGGGLRAGNMRYDVVDCVFRGNTAGDDGGAAYHVGWMRYVRTLFENNSAPDGGALYSNTATIGLHADVTDCTFLGNNASVSGGVYNCFECNQPVFTRCTFTSNSAPEGGVVAGDDGTPQFYDCVFANNTARNGGVVASVTNAQFDPTLHNCNYTGNVGLEKGGVYYIEDGTTTDNDGYAAGNYAPSGGFSYTINTAAQVYLDGTLVTNNTADWDPATPEYTGCILANENGGYTRLQNNAVVVGNAGIGACTVEVDADVYVTAGSYVCGNSITDLMCSLGNINGFAGTCTYDAQVCGGLSCDCTGGTTGELYAPNCPLCSDWDSCAAGIHDCSPLATCTNVGTAAEWN